MERGCLKEGFLKEGFQLSFGSGKSGCVVDVCWEGVPDKWRLILILKGPLTEVFFFLLILGIGRSFSPLDLRE